ncbi:MAG: response regulator [Candidatus Dadabacteria bacterium]|nr:MAG: response regulator [Candidatus Dadabacteria bacterium]
MSRTVRAFSIILITLLAFPLLASSAYAESRRLEPVTLQLKWYHQFQFAGFYAAKLKGYYRDEGLDVTIRERIGDEDHLQDVIQGVAEYGVSGPELLYGRLKGLPLVALAVIFQHSPYVLITRAKDNIRTPADLSGKKVMISDALERNMFIAMFKKAGVPWDSINIVKHTRSVNELAEGKVAAMSGYMTTQGISLKLRGIEPYYIKPIDYGIDCYGDTLFTTEEELKNHPDRVDAMIRASIRGWEYALSHENEVIDHILTLPGVKERGITRTRLELEAQATRPAIMPQLIEIGHMNPARWNNMARLLAETGLVSPDFSLEGFMYSPKVKLDYTPYYILAAAVLLLLGIVFIVTRWNKQLKKSVEARTRQLECSTKQIKAFFQASPDIMFFLKPDGTIFGYNCGDPTQLYLKPEDFMGRRMQDLLPADSARRFKEAIELINTSGEMQTFEYQLRVPAGLHWFEARLVKAKDGDLATIVRNITDRKITDSSLREQAARLKRAQEISQLGFIEWNVDTNEIFWSEQTYRIFGVSEDIPPTFESTIERVHPDDRDLVVSRLKLASEGKQEYDIDHRIVTPAGEVRYVHGVADLRTNINGERLLVGTMHDISDRVKAEEQNALLESQLQQAQKLETLGTLAGGIAHDFNNILSPLIGYLELALGDDAVKGDLKEYLDRAYQSAKRGARLAKQILLFSGKSTQRLAPCYLQETVEDALELLRATIPANIELKKEISNDCPPVMTDPIQIHQIIMNLGTNAAHAMRPTGGRLTVSLSEATVDRSVSAQRPNLKPGRYVRITVKDTGCGMDEKTLSSIFDPFFTTKPAGEGTGLGLAVVHGIVQKHGGDIIVESAPDRGTTFSVYLPPTDKLPEKKESSPTTNLHGRERILLVDDEELIAEVSKEMLEQLGYQVTICTAGRAALEKLRNNPAGFDLVVTDLSMHDITGSELAREIESICPGMPVILTSGYSVQGDSGDLNGTIRAFLAKPFGIRELAATIRKVLDSSVIKART